MSLPFQLRSIAGPNMLLLCHLETYDKGYGAASWGTE